MHAKSIATLAVLAALLSPAAAGAHGHHHARMHNSVKRSHRHAARVHGAAAAPVGAPNFGPQTPEEEALWRKGMEEQGFTPAEVAEIED
jgi:hypothetical protein